MANRVTIGLLFYILFRSSWEKDKMDNEQKKINSEFIAFSVFSILRFSKKCLTRMFVDKLSDLVHYGIRFFGFYFIFSLYMAYGIH